MPLEIHVVPRPEGANGPIGTFTIACNAIAGAGDWPGLSVNVKGSGDLSHVEGPRPIGDGGELVVEEAAPQHVGGSDGASRWWTWRMHSTDRSVRFPSFELAYFDPESMAAKTATCEPREVDQVNPLRAARPEQPIQPSKERPNTAPVEVTLLLLVTPRSSRSSERFGYSAIR